MKSRLDLLQGGRCWRLLLRRGPGQTLSLFFLGICYITCQYSFSPFLLGLQCKWASKSLECNMTSAPFRIQNALVDMLCVTYLLDT